MLRNHPNVNQQHYQYGTHLDLSGGIDPELRATGMFPKALPISERLWTLAAAVIEHSRDTSIIEPHLLEPLKLYYNVSLLKGSEDKNIAAFFQHSLSLSRIHPPRCIPVAFVEFTIYEMSKRESVYEYLRALDSILGLADIQQFLTILEFLDVLTYLQTVTRLTNEKLVLTWAQLTNFWINSQYRHNHPVVGGRVHQNHISFGDQSKAVQDFDISYDF